MSEAAAGGESQNPKQGEGSNASGSMPVQMSEQTWLGSLDPELRDSPSAKKFKGKTWDEVGPTLFKSYHNLERWQIPGDDAKPEERAAFHRRLGIPEKVDEYAAGLKPAVPEGVPWNPEIQSQFASFAHTEGIPAGTATKILNWYLERAGQGVDIQTTETATTLRKQHESLQQRWGASYQRNVGLVQRAVEEYGKPEFSALMDSIVVKGPDGADMKLGNHPVMLEFLAGHGEQRLEAGFIPGDSLLTTTQSAQTDLSKILDDPQHPYWQGDKAAIAKVQSLLAITDAPKRR